MPRSRLSIILVTLATAAGCTTTVGQLDTAGPERTVREVTIDGNEAISDGELIDGLATKPPQGFLLRQIFVFDPLALQVDADRIERYYRSQGYFSAAVRETDVARAGDRVDVTIKVEEGQPTLVRELSLTGVPDRVPREQVERALNGLVEGERFQHEEYLRAKRVLRTRLVEAGYAHARVDGRVVVDREARTATVTLAADPGPLTRLGSLAITGNRRIPDSAVANRVAWEEGDTFDLEALELTKGRLYDLGVFSWVSVNYQQEGRPEAADVVIRVEEAHRHQVQLGGGVAADQNNWQVRARATYTQRSFLLPLMTLRVDARPAYLFQRNAATDTGFGGEARASTTLDDFLVPRLRLTNQVQWEQTRFESYGIRGPGARIELMRPLLTDRLTVAGAWEIRDYSFFDLSEALEPGISPLSDAELRELGIIGGYRLAYLDQTITYDNRDDLFAPTRGVYLELRAEEATSFVGSGFDYLRGSAEARGYLSPTRQLVLAARARYGRSLAGDLPITHRFYAGGAASHRGFAFRRLSPTVSAGEEIARIGGEERLESNFEVRYNAFQFRDQWVGVVAFADGGDVPPNGDSVALDDLHWAVGGGLRYNTIVGPIRFDLGRRVTRTGAPEPGSLWAFHFSIGEAF